MLLKLLPGTMALALIIAPVNAQEAPAPAAGEPVPQMAPAADAQTVASLQARVKNLEEQIIDLRAMIGTYSSMGRRQGAGEPAAYAGQNERARSRRPSSLPWQGPRQGPDRGTSQDRPQGQIEPQGSQPSKMNKRPLAEFSPPPKRPDLQEDGVVSDRMAAVRQPDQQNSSSGLRDPQNNDDATTLYKDAYGHMLRRDYASAQSAFGALIKNHPQSRMAGNAQYWLGETYYVRGKYRPAADAFLKAYRDYSDGIKAPDSLMKLALSLARLGQKGAACKTFDELDAKYPNAPSHVKQRAGMERRRAGCS